MARFARSVAAREVLVAAARAAGAAGLALMPVKGVVVAALACRHPADRLLDDADALAPPGGYEATKRALTGAGFRLVRDEGFQAALAHPTLGLTLDLHETLFPKGIFRFDTAALHARGRDDEATFGVRVRLPDPVDMVAHACAHAAFDLLRRHRISHPDDVQRIADRWGLSAGAVAARMWETGCAAASRFVLRETVRVTGSPFAAEVLGALGADPAGRVLVAALEGWARVVPARGWLARLPAALAFRTPEATLRNVARAVRRDVLRRK